MRRALFVAFLLLTAVAVQAQQPQLRIKYRSDINWIDLSWSQVPGASSYVIRRASVYPAWEWSLNAGNNVNAGIGAPAANSAYVYQVYAVDSASQPVGTPSAGALVVTSGFAEPVTIGTPVRASHVNELRTLVNRARRAAGLADATWTFPARAAGDPVKREDVSDLRTALDAALQNVGLAPPAYTDPALTTSTIIRKLHVNELRTRVMNWPELVLPTSALVSEPYFSPNADGVKDTTRVDVAFRVTTEVGWTLNVRNLSNVVVRSLTGFGTGFSFTWDGRNNSGAMQPDGLYFFDVHAANGLGSMTPTLNSTLDNTLPGATIASPTEGQQLSNIHASGSGTFALTGTATDANFTTWVLERTGNSQPDVTLFSGTSQITTTASFGSWQTLPASGSPLPNGAYTLRLTASDRAGNKTIVNRNVTVGHFTAELVGHQINTTASPAQTVRYTSKVPFTINEVVTVRKADLTTVVRTLHSGPRGTGTWDDYWDGRDSSGVLLGDGPYYLYAVVTAGSSTFTWDESNTSLGGGTTQFNYPTCRNDAGALVSCDSSTLKFDPFTNKPLRINFCVGGGDVATGCTGNTPARVTAKISALIEDPGTCDTYCIDTFIAGAGPQEILWYGTNRSGQYIAGISTRLLVLRAQTYSRNAVVLVGSAPKISLFDMEPMHFFNPGGPIGQSFIVDIVSPAGRSVSVSAQFRNIASLSVLRTITLAPSTASRQTLTWDGRADNGAWVAPGHYEVTLKATDSAGGTATVKPIVAVRY